MILKIRKKCQTVVWQKWSDDADSCFNKNELIIFTIVFGSKVKFWGNYFGNYLSLIRLNNSLTKNICFILILF